MSKAEKKFDIDLAKGLAMEDTFKEFLEGKKVEVKSERHIWEITGNHFLEYIEGIEIPVMTYIVPTDIMKDLGRKYLHTKTMGGDDNMSWGVLVPIEEIALSCLNNL